MAASVICAGVLRAQQVDVSLQPFEAVASEGDILSLSIVLQSVSGSNVQIGGMELVFQFDPSALEFVGFTEDGEYDWLTFDLGAGAVNNSLTDGDILLSAIPQLGMPLPPQPFANPVLDAGSVQFRVLDTFSTSQVTIPASIPVVFNRCTGGGNSGAACTPDCQFNNCCVDAVECPGGCCLKTVDVASLVTGVTPGLNIARNFGSFVLLGDCNENLVRDSDEIAADPTADCNNNMVLDVCEIGRFSSSVGGPFFCDVNCDPDCNLNGKPDGCDLDPSDPDGNGKVSDDCQNGGVGNGIPDECEDDCNCNSQPDIGETLAQICAGPGASGACDCNGNGRVDECDITPGFCEPAPGCSLDVNANGLPDECEKCGDLNSDGTIDVFDLLCILAASAASCNPAVCACSKTDLEPCCGDGIVDVFDMLAALAAFAGATGPNECCTPCP